MNAFHTSHTVAAHQFKSRLPFYLAARILQPMNLSFIIDSRTYDIVVIQKGEWREARGDIWVEHQERNLYRDPEHSSPEASEDCDSVRYGEI